MTQPQQTQPRLSDAYAQAVAATHANLLAYGAAVYAAAAASSAAFDQAALALMVARIVPTIAAAQMRVANLTAAYFARDLGAPPATVTRELVTGGRGVPATQVYSRPMVAARSALTEGKTVDEAREIGSRRLESLLSTDLQMAKIRQADTSLQESEVTFYRRVPRSSGACALCLIASTQKYKVHALMPIHPGCQCGIEALKPGVDLDRDFDAAKLLEATHARVKEFIGIEDRGGRAPDYRKLLITRQHGELGEVLAYRGYKFTGPGQIVQNRPSPVDLPHVDLDN